MDAAEFEAHLERYQVDYVATDAGSIDPGPPISAGLPMTHLEGLRQALQMLDITAYEGRREFGFVEDRIAGLPESGAVAQAGERRQAVSASV